MTTPLEIPKCVVIFDDSRDALKRYANAFNESGCELLYFRRPEVDVNISTALVAFQPSLIIVDLVMGESREDGYRLIAQLREVPFRGGIPPIVVCSKLITKTPMGEGEKARALAEPGVKAAFGKYPDLPSAQEFLSLDRKTAF